MKLRILMAIAVVFFYASALGSAKYFWLHGGIGPALAAASQFFAGRGTERLFKHVKTSWE